MNHFSYDSESVAEVRNRCLYLLKELEDWDIKPFYRERVSIRKTIKYTLNTRRLVEIHDILETKLENAMLQKLKQGL